MRAQVLTEQNKPTQLKDVNPPSPGKGQVLLKVSACAVCRTDLHILDGELPDPKLPLIMGHQIVGTVMETGPDVSDIKKGDRLGVPWLGSTCGACPYCRSGQENLCDNPQFTGYTTDGGFAEYTVANRDYCFEIPGSYSDVEAAPLLCGGLIGYRAFRKAGAVKKIGFYGFGSAAHILARIAVGQGVDLYAFTKPGDHEGQEFAKSLGAVWAGGSDEAPPELLDAAIIFAPVGKLIPEALGHVKKGGAVISAGIHMSDIPQFPYQKLWGERVIRSIANLTRKDGELFFEEAKKHRIQTETHLYPLEKLNEALEDLRNGAFSGTAVITIE